MDLATFKKLNKVFSRSPLSKEVSQTPEYDAYCEAINEDKACGDWYLKKLIRKAGINYKKYCCLHMAYHLIEDKKSRNAQDINYDSVMTHRTRQKDFGIPIHDGGSSYIKINFCPWCGKEL